MSHVTRLSRHDREPEEIHSVSGFQAQFDAAEAVSERLNDIDGVERISLLRNSTVNKSGVSLCNWAVCVWCDNTALATLQNSPLLREDLREASGGLPLRVYHIEGRDLVAIDSEFDRMGNKVKGSPVLAGDPFELAGAAIRRMVPSAVSSFMSRLRPGSSHQEPSTNGAPHTNGTEIVARTAHHQAEA